MPKPVRSPCRPRCLRCGRCGLVADQPPQGPGTPVVLAVSEAQAELIDKFKIEAVPSMVEQEQDRIKVKQFKLKD